jgi:DNA ligase (NAD+)
MKDVTNNQTEPKAASKTQKLANLIMLHKRLYYAGTPQISDADYDKIEDELRSLSPDHPALSYVGTDTSSQGRKVHHEKPMLSLQKTYNLSELDSWAANRDIMGTLKVDGASMSLVYEGGRLSLAKTRGNGRVGEDVTDKIFWVSDCLKDIGDNLDFEVRGELYCSEHQFALLVEEMIALGLERPSSPRNIVAGLLGRKSYIDLARYFNFLAFDIHSEELQFATEQEKFKWLDHKGFRLPHPRILRQADEIHAYIEEVRQIMAEGDIGLDGAVFSYNDISLHQQLGHTSHHPRYKMSYKWQGQTALSEISDITWSTSRLGVVTPVAVIEPVELSGAKITNITLHNAEHVKAYNLKVGDTIEIIRSGEVIPKFLEVKKQAEGSYSWPEICSSCQTKLIYDGVRLRCPNTLSCSAQQSGSILNWIRSAEIDDLSEKRLETMMDVGLVVNAQDLYHLKKEDFLKLPLVKEKMAEKLYRNIQSSKNLPLARFLNGLGIEGVGLTSWEKILSVLGSFEALREASIDDLIAIDGFAEKSARQIVEGLKQRSPLIESLLDAGVEPQFLPPNQSPDGNSPLQNKNIAITGTLSRPRSELETIIKNAGGHPTSSISKNTFALVANDKNSTSSKMKKAVQLNIPIWSEEELLAVINS